MLIMSAWARQHTALLILAVAILSASHCGYQKSHCSHSQPSTEKEKKSQYWQAVKPSTCVDFIGKHCQLLGLFLCCQTNPYQLPFPPFDSGFQIMQTQLLIMSWGTRPIKHICMLLLGTAEAKSNCLVVTWCQVITTAVSVVSDY